MNDGTITNTCIVFKIKYFFKYFLYNETKHRLSSRCSPNNLEVEEEEDKEREGEEREGGESIVLEETAGLVFGGNDSYEK